MQAAFFDIDRTLLEGSTGMIYSRLLLQNGFIRLKHFLMITYYVIQYNLNVVDYEKAMKKGYAATKGLDVVLIRKFMKKHYNLIHKRIYPEMRKIIEDHRKKGRMIVFVTNSWQPMVEDISHELKADHLISTEVVVKDGTYTGELRQINYGIHKKNHMEHLAERSGIDLKSSYAYSDHHSDRFMLSAVGKPVAVNPDPKLAKISRNNSWKVMRL